MARRVPMAPSGRSDQFSIETTAGLFFFFWYSEINVFFYSDLVSFEIRDGASVLFIDDIA